MAGSEEYPPQHPKDGEAQASLRAEILQQIAVAQLDIERALSVISAGDARIPLALQLANLAAIRQQVSFASPSALAKMQSEANAAIATAQALTDVSAGSAAEAGPKSLATAVAEARHAVQSFVEDYYEKRKFDQFLEFASDDDERAYREREKKRRAEIEQASAEGTTQGAAKALQLAWDQWKDAGAHGADKSPDFKAEGERLEKASRNLDDAIVAGADAPSPSSPTDQHIATLRKAGVTVADQSGEGHGVKMDASIAQFLGRA